MKQLGKDEWGNGLDSTEQRWDRTVHMVGKAGSREAGGTCRNDLCPLCLGGAL